MKAMILERCAKLSEQPEPLRLAELPTPEPSGDELLVRVRACGVCHTELDEIEGRLVPSRLPIVPGHEVVGVVVGLGDAVHHRQLGDRVGIGWIHHSAGGPEENLSPEFVATGRDVDGGYAEYMKVPERYAVPIPERLGDREAAPLMCAGAIGYRALRLAQLDRRGPLGLMGFGGSAHLVLQLAKHLHPETPVFAFDRHAEVQAFARELGADWAGGIDDAPPAPLAAIIDTTPAWRPVVASLAKLQPGGRLVINAIRKEADDQRELLHLSYHEHLWMEREIKSVANLVRDDIAEFLPLAAAIPIRPATRAFPLQAANEALRILRRGAIRGANVLVMEES